LTGIEAMLQRELRLAESMIRRERRFNAGELRFPERRRKLEQFIDEMTKRAPI
jgi:hypothetical protein